MISRKGRLRQILIICTVVATFLLLLTSLKTSIGDQQKSVHVVVFGGDDKRLSEGGHKKKDMVHAACNIPKLEMNGSEVKDFFFPAPPLNCDKKNAKNWVVVDEDGLMVLIPERESAKCELFYFIRKTDTENKVLPKKPFVNKARMEHDFANVVCQQKGETWSGLLMSIAFNQQLVNNKKPLVKGNNMNVFILVTDSLSQMTYRRKLPKTVEFLESTLGSVVLNGYNIVGDGTPQAIIPMLTAQTEVELPLTRKRYPQAHFVDDVYPFIWNNFSTKGYATCYGEDAFGVGTFSYRLKGFRNAPSDHFLRPFFEQHEKTGGHCLGSIPLHHAWYNYARQFMKSYQELPRFLMMHESLLSHDDINLVGVEDDHLSQFLAKMNDDGMFKNTLVILMADHGHRFFKLRETQQGQLEERLPFVSIALPPDFIATDYGAKMYENLKTNKDRLSTPFDLYSTLWDILNPPPLEQLTGVQSVKNRSLSLFRSIPESRTCDEAGIETHWCACLNWEDAYTSEEDKKTSNYLASLVVDAMNEQLKEVTHLCANLTLKGIEYSKKLIPNDKVLKYKTVKDKDGFVPDLTGNTKAVFAHYQIKLTTKPGRAAYEVTLFYDSSRNLVHLDLSAISHVTAYGDDPHCIIDSNYFLATYCVCHDRV